METIGKRLKSLRKAVGLTQQKLADALGITQTTVGMWEVNKSTMTDRSTRQICATFGVSYDWLTTGTGEMFEQSDEQLVNGTMQAYPQFGDLERRILENWIKLPHSKLEEIHETIQRCFVDDPNSDGDI